MSVRIGLVGYGLGGRVFHAPFIQVAQGCDLVGVVTRNQGRRRAVASDLPGVPVFPSLEELIKSGVDAVVISTPPMTRRSLVLEALALGVHVVADKPFAPDASEAQELVDAAEKAGLVLSVFHNRRWDTDFATLADVIERGSVGTVWRFDSRLDLDQASSIDPGPSGGLVRDLGSHLVDQALVLFGDATFVSANLDWLTLPAGSTDVGFAINVEHASGVHSHLSASKANHADSRELRAMGSRGTYVSTFTDVQARDILAGIRPSATRETWGYERPENWGHLLTEEGVTRVPSLQGDYARFYEGFASAVMSGSPPPVLPREAVATLRVLDAARVSALEHRTVPVAP